MNWAYRPTAAIVWTEENAIRMKRSLIRAVMADHGTMAPDAIGALGGVCRSSALFSGDTAFHSELFQEIRIFEPDIAVLSVNGAFGNMNAEEGAAAAELTGARYAVPCHFWTFMEHGGLPGQFVSSCSKRDLPAASRQGRFERCNVIQIGKKEGDRLMKAIRFMDRE